MTPAEMLAFERQWWRQAGPKEQAIRSRFGVGPVRYYQRLNALLQDETALQIDAATVRRLQRMREGTR